MKTKSILLLLLLYTTVTLAQKSINYKAVIKDFNGNALVNTDVDVQFTILKTSETGTVAYQENHTDTTDDNGLIVLNIGTGTATSNDFSDIDWDSDAHFLKVEVDIGSGLVDLGTTEFMAVPYALNVSGLEKITEGVNIGWRLKGRDETNYGDIGKNAVDFSESLVSSTINGATGDYSMALGQQSSAQGEFSVAMGNGSFALGEMSFAFGQNPVAQSLNEIVLGSYNETYAPGTNGTTAWNDTDRLFVLGNGPAFDNRSNALVVLKNGSITAPSFDISEIIDNKSLITKEYADSNLSSTGLEALDEGNGVGWRLKGRDPDNYAPIGVNAVDLSIKETVSSTHGASGENSIAIGVSTTASGASSTAMGELTTASGLVTTAMGFLTTATGFSSTALGLATTASGFYSTAMGNGTIATGPTSTAMGKETEAIGDSSFAAGLQTKVSADNATAIGEYNFDHMTSLFMVGNGTSNTTRNNALTIFKTGHHIINSDVVGLGVYPGSDPSYDGIQIYDAGRYGINVLRAGSNGITVLTPGDDGISILSPGDDGVQIDNSAVDGIVINSPGDDGVQIESPGGDGITMFDSGGDGVNILSPGDNGVEISNAVGDGVHITASQNNGIQVNSPVIDGIQIVSPGNNGVQVNFAQNIGGFFNGINSGVHAVSTVNDNPDLILGGISSSSTGDNGIIASDPAYAGSDIFLRSYDAVAIQLDYDNNETGEFEIKAGSGAEIFEITESGNATLAGTLTQNSDRRLKKDISNLEYGLSEVLQLQPRSYRWKGRATEKKSLGLIAQEVQPIINEIVNSQDDDAKTLGISYIELIPVLIKAIQEQQEIIADQDIRLKDQKDINSRNIKEIEQLDKRLEALMDRVNRIETSNK